MKFVADMGVSPKTVAFLKSQGHDVFRLNERGMQKAEDEEILELARSEVGMVRRSKKALSRTAGLSTDRHKYAAGCFSPRAYLWRSVPSGQPGE